MTWTQSHSSQRSHRTVGNGRLLYRTRDRKHWLNGISTFQTDQQNISSTTIKPSKYTSPTGIEEKLMPHTGIPMQMMSGLWINPIWLLASRPSPKKHRVLLM